MKEKAFSGEKKNPSRKSSGTLIVQNNYVKIELLTKKSPLHHLNPQVLRKSTLCILADEKHIKR